MQIHTPSRRLKAILLLLTAGLLVSSCTSVSIVNNSSVPVQVTIMMSPFDGGKLTTLPPGGEEFELSPIGGYFAVEIVRGDDLLNEMNILKVLLDNALKQPNIDPLEIAGIIDKLNETSQKIAAVKAAKSSDGCAGLVPDFASATGVIVDTSDGGIAFGSCVIEQPTTEGEPPA